MLRFNKLALVAGGEQACLQEEEQRAAKSLEAKMSRIEVLALMAGETGEDIARLPEEEQRRKEMQQRTERRYLVGGSSDENGDDDGGGDGSAKEEEERKENILRTCQNKKRKREADNDPNLAAVLPPKFKDMILEKAQGEPVEDAVLVIQKKLTRSDIDKRQNRFLIPLKQMRNQFLNEEDENFIEGHDAKGKCNAVEVDIIEPTGKVRRVHVTRW